MELKRFREFVRTNRVQEDSEKYDCSAKRYRPFKVKRSKRSGKFVLVKDAYIAYEDPA